VPPLPAGLLDAHSHVQEEVLAPYLPAVMRRAAAAGVTGMVVNGTSETDWPDVLRLSRDYPGVIPCFGLHPWFVGARSPDWLDRLAAHLDAMPSALGEIGLDRLVRDRDEAAQERCFREQLALAGRRGLPVMVHCFRAWGWLLDILREAGRPPGGMLIHAYGGAPDLVPELAAMGTCFSFAGNVLDPRHQRARAALAAIPLDRLLVETDAPAMLPPEPFRPQVTIAPGGAPLNEPANLPAIVGGIAALRGMTPEALVDVLRANLERLLSGLPSA
jgi:TatD DNase family protein